MDPSRGHLSQRICQRDLGAGEALMTSNRRPEKKSQANGRTVDKQLEDCLCAYGFDRQRDHHGDADEDL